MRLFIRTRRVLCVSLAAAGLLVLPSACRDAPPNPTAPHANGVRLRPPLLTSRSATAPEFAWLAPLGVATADPATFYASAAPVVEVCRSSGTACAGTPVARFTTAPVGAERPLTVNAAAGRYEAAWSLLDPSFTARRTYRIRVLRGAAELGAASVDMVRGRWALTRGDGTRAPLAAAMSLPIRFTMVVPALPAAITPASIITTIAGTGVQGFSGDGGPAKSAEVNAPASLAFGPDGSYYISAGDGRIRRVWPNGIITTVAGTGTLAYGGDGGPATAAQLHWPHADAVGPDGTVYIADYANCRVRKIDPSGIITTIAGTGRGIFYGDEPAGDGGPATAAQVCPNGLARTTDGTLYVSEYAPSNRVRRIGTNGIITTYAGNGSSVSSGDGGPALLAGIYNPHGIVAGPDGSIYVSENGGARIRRIAPSGTISTVVGTGVSGFSGDGGPATSAQISVPYAITIGPDGALYFVDGYGPGPRIRRVGMDGVVGTVAGTGVNGYGGDGGPAGRATFWAAAGLVFAPDGALLVGDMFNHRVRRIK